MTSKEHRPRKTQDRGGTGQGMVPFILLQLAEKPAHGYELVQAIAALGFRRLQEDRSVLYKVLRDLEYEGVLTSELSPGSGGPARRVYTLTSVGEAYLHDRVQDLRRQANRIDVLLARYEQLFAEEAISSRRQ